MNPDGNIQTTKGERMAGIMRKSIRYIKKFNTKGEQVRLIKHLTRLGIDCDYGIQIENGNTFFYVKAFN